MTEDRAREILGVYREDGADKIRARYRLLARMAHPDAGGSSETFQELHAAYALLSGPSQAERQQAAVERQRLRLDLKAAEEAIVVETARSAQYSLLDFRRKILGDWIKRRDALREKLASLGA